MNFVITLAKQLHRLSINHKGLKKFVRTVHGPQLVCNINYQGGMQKRILLCYLPQCFEPLANHVSHPNILHSIAIVNSFIKMGYCIDVCYSNDDYAYELLKDISYDYLFGFGCTFDRMVEKNKKNTAILLVTENDPSVVSLKYKERVEYFRERHPNWLTKPFITRDSFYNTVTFAQYDTAIIMNSTYNIEHFKQKFQNCYPINVNGLYNPSFSIADKISDVSKSKNRFLWFGSTGLLHKGLDILIDAFNELPDFSLDVYGVNKNELKAIKNIPSNVIIKGIINVNSDDFIEVAKSNRYVVSASCSEGMNTGIATCMLHGIIPIVTRETGFDYHKDLYEMKSYKVKDIVEQIKTISTVTDEVIAMQMQEIYDYAHSLFTIEHFSSRFEAIVKEIIAD